jgi:hypothetical protein
VKKLENRNRSREKFQQDKSLRQLQDKEKMERYFLMACCTLTKRGSLLLTIRFTKANFLVFFSFPIEIHLLISLPSIENCDAKKGKKKFKKKIFIFGIFSFFFCLSLFHCLSLTFPAIFQLSTHCPNQSIVLFFSSHFTFIQSIA